VNVTFVTVKLVEAYVAIMLNPNTYHYGLRQTRGHVGAWLIIPGRPPIWGHSYRKGNLWTHAERDCIEKALKLYGSIPDDCVMITTLEPCSLNADKDPHMSSRKGCSCSQLLGEHNIKTVYCGTRDVGHFVDGKEPKHPFKLLTVDNLIATMVCDRLYKRVTGEKLLVSFY
jgi:pyrimidine deaminase RibD-like protein